MGYFSQKQTSLAEKMARGTHVRLGRYARWKRDVGDRNKAEKGSRREGAWTEEANMKN
jgi:hypothetical protein